MKLPEFIKTLKEKVKKTNSLIKKLEEFEKLKQKGAISAYEMEKVVNSLERIKDDELLMGGDFRKILDFMKSEVEELKRELKYEFMRGLENELRREGLNFRISYPDVYVFPIKVTIDPARGRAIFSYGYDKIDETTMDLKKIASKIKAHRLSITKPVNSKEEVKVLFDAYRRVLSLKEGRVGDRLPVSEVMVQYVLLKQPRSFYADPSKKNFREISRARFSYILYLMRKEGVRTEEGLRPILITATLDATRRREGFIWIPDNETGSGTVYAYISFRRE